MTPRRIVTPRRARSRHLASPRDVSDRILLLGPEVTAEVELLALILGGDDSIERALDLLREFDGLRGLDRATPQQLACVPGVGLARALALVAALELGRRVATLPLPYARTIERPHDVAAFLRASLGAATREMFLVMGLDVRRRLQMVRRIAIGSLCRVQVHPREVFRPLVSAGMWGALLVHNHPSGVAQPSDDDVAMTRRMAEVGRVLGIVVVDSLVVTREETMSLREMGLLEAPPDE